MSHSLFPCPHCGAANDPGAGRCDQCGQSLPVEPSVGRELEQSPAPQQAPRPMRRRALLAGIAAGAVTVLGGVAYLGYTRIPKGPSGQRPPTLTYTGHEGSAQDAAWSPDGTRVASIGSPGGGGTAPSAVHVWDAATGKRLLLCTVQDAAPGLAPARVVWSTDGGHLLAVVAGPVSATSLSALIDRVQVWDAATGQIVRSIVVQRIATVWALNDRYLAVATQVAQAQDSAQRGALISPTSTPPATPTPPATRTPAQPTPIAAVRDIIEIWELATGKLVATLDVALLPGYNGFEKIVWAPESSQLAVSTLSVGPGATNSAWHIWDAPARKELQTFAIPSQDHIVLAWSWDGKFLALGPEIDNLATGRRTASYRVDGFLYAQAWAPDGKRIAVWVRAGTGLYSTKYDVISLIDTSNGKQITTFNGGVSETSVEPPVVPSPLAWSPDGKRLLVVRSGNVEVWRLG